MSLCGTNLPQPAPAQTAASVANDTRVVLEYTQAGGIAINHQPVALADVESRLREIYRDRHDKTCM